MAGAGDFDPVTPRGGVMDDWKTAQSQAFLQEAIRLFKKHLPGWWYSVGECQVSCDASCGPTVESEHIHLIPLDDRFNSGFHADLPQPSTLADALYDVINQALDAIKAGEANK